ncbi:hypothetical protein NKH41_30420 [Mesorhizobium sp. M1169]|uniref:hypothetical protein n=1 Tax=Mesorhizobium sp. M1169 TaxID=2957066 RepID=UPI003339B9B8
MIAAETHFVRRRKLLSAEHVEETRSYLIEWAKAVHVDLSPQGIYAFGSLVYRDGAQFNDKSDVDLAIVVAEIPDAADRADWFAALLRHKLVLEDELGKRLGRADRSAILCSVVAAGLHRLAVQGGFGHRDYGSGR